MGGGLGLDVLLFGSERKQLGEHVWWRRTNVTLHTDFLGEA